MAAAAAPPPGRLVYHLTRRTWEVRWFGAQPPTTWTAPPAISRQTLQAVSIRGGRSSHEEKTAWSNSTRLLLRTEPWSISRTTEFAEVEQLVVVLSVSITHCPMRNPCDGAPVDIGLCHSLHLQAASIPKLSNTADAPAHRDHRNLWSFIGAIPYQTIWPDGLGVLGPV